MCDISDNQKLCSRKTSDHRFHTDKRRPPMAVPSRRTMEAASESRQLQPLKLTPIVGHRQTEGLRPLQPARRKITSEDHGVVGPLLPGIKRWRNPVTATVSSKTKEIQTGRKDEELNVARKSSSPVRLPTSDQKKEQNSRIFRQSRPCTLSPRDQVTPVESSTFQPTPPPPKRQNEGTQRLSGNLSSVSHQPQLQQTKEQNRRTFRQLRPCTLRPRDQATPADLSKFQPTPPPKREHEGTQQQQQLKITEASANFSSVSPQPKLRHKRLSLKDIKEAAEKAWREEEEKREEPKIEEVVEEEQESNIDKTWDLKSIKREISKTREAIKSSRIKKLFVEKKIELLNKTMRLCQYRLNRALDENKSLEKMRQLQQDPSLPLKNKLMTEKISEVYEDCGGVFNDADVNSKEKELEGWCLDACKFIETHKLQSTINQRFEDFEDRKMKQQLAEQEALNKQKREEWWQYRRQKRQTIALAPPVLITGRKLMPRSPPPKPKKKEEPVQLIWEDSIMDIFDNFSHELPFPNTKCWI